MTKLRFTHRGVVSLAILGQSAVSLADCYVDSQAGDDTKDAQSEANAVKTQAKIPTSCTVIRYKRGSLFNEAVKMSGSNKAYTNYGNASDPLPKFVVPHTTSSGSIVSSFQGNVTLDGLYLAGSHGDGTMANLSQGVCVMLGGNSKLLNCEISNCDIGIMLSGTGSLVQGNYVHDLTMAVDAASGVDPNSVGGAEGIFINGSNNEVAYNSFVNCSSAAAWTGGSCDGGATEVTVGAGATLGGVKVHHNFSFNSCGFFEVSSGGSSKGTFSDSEFYYNVSIDSGWLMLLQVNNTNLSNIRWENNTIVQHSGSSNAGMLTTIFTGTSSGQTGGSLAAGLVSMTNNLIVFDGVNPFGTVIDANITQTTNLIVNTASQSPGMVNVKGMTSASDFDLTSSSPAIDKGTTIAGLAQDYLNRAVPTGSAPDIGAFEYGAPGAGGSSATGGATATGGSAAGTGGVKATGGATSATGGKSSAGGVSSASTGGAPGVAGGTANTGGGAGIVAPSGGVSATGGAVSVTGGAVAITGGHTGTSTTGGTIGNGGIANTTGGVANATGGIVNSAGGTTGPGGQTPANTWLGGASSVASATAGSGNGTSADNVGACSCSTVGRRTQWSSAALVALLVLGLRRQKRKQSN
jgi:hypothetical protein